MHLCSSGNNEFDGRFEFGEDAHRAMDDFATASHLFNSNLELSMTLAASDVAATTVINRRFLASRTDFIGFEKINIRRVRGRIGGDTGNRKRRVATRIDNFVEHQVRTRVSEREGREAIEFGVAEYERNRRQAIAYAEAKRTLHAFDGTSIATTPEGMIRHGRTGALVAVVHKTPRAVKKTALAASATKNPRPTANQVRAKLGLPSKN